MRHTRTFHAFTRRRTKYGQQIGLRIKRLMTGPAAAPKATGRADVVHPADRNAPDRSDLAQRIQPVVIFRAWGRWILRLQSRLIRAIVPGSWGINPATIHAKDDSRESGMARTCNRGSCPRDGKRRWLVIPACGPVQMDLCDRHDLEIRETFGQLGKALDSTLAAALSTPSRTEREPVGHPPAGSCSGAGPAGSLRTGPDPKADALGTYYLTRQELDQGCTEILERLWSGEYGLKPETHLRIDWLILAARLFIVAADDAVGTGQW